MVVQVSAFRDVGKAHELIDELKNRGYPAFAGSGSGGIDGWHRVFVGPYPEKEVAGRTLAKLGQEGFSKGFVTTMEKSHQ